MCSTQHCLSQALCIFWTPKTIPKPRNIAPFTSQRPSAKLGQHYPHPCFVLLAHCPRGATDACGATMCSTQPCLPRAFCTFCNDACDASGLPSRCPPFSLASSRLAPLHLNPVPTRAPPVSLPSIFPPQPRPHPCAFRLAPLHLLVPTHAPPVSLPSICSQPRPHPCASRLAPLPSFPSLPSLPSPPSSFPSLFPS